MSKDFSLFRIARKKALVNSNYFTRILRSIQRFPHIKDLGREELRWEEGARATLIKIGDIERTQYTRTIRNGKLENPALRPLMFLVGTQQPVPSSALFCRCYKEATHCIGRSMEGKH